MGYAQWMSATIAPASGLNVVIQYAQLSYGKWCVWNNIGSTIPVPDGLVTKGGTTNAFGACGRDDSPSGTTGNFDIYDTASTPNVLIGSFYFNCPYGAGSNTAEWVPNPEGAYTCAVTGYNTTNNGALGNGTFTITKG